MDRGGTLTEMMLASVPGNPLVGLEHVDDRWQQYRQGNIPVPEVIKEHPNPLGELDWDVVICGGTLGVMLGATLAQRGWRVAILERGDLRGREQEWNISRRELQELVDLGLLSPKELEAAIASAYNPARIQFHGGDPVWVEDVLNVGVDPVVLLEQLKQKFLNAGGQVFEQTLFEGAVVHPDGVNVQASGSYKTRLLVDAMGHFSPIAAQQRQGQRPDGVCLVVGTCADGYSHNSTGDLIYSFTPIRNQCQYFWEAFPAKDGRTTYMFTYLDAHPERPSLRTCFEDYWRLLPEYQQTPLESLQVRRALFGFFPCYRNSPLQYQWSRLLAVGDSSGSQSPLSFGGFGAMIRHLPRLSQGVDEALNADALSRSSLSWLQPYQPNLAVTWLFQRSMSVGVHQSVPDHRINQLLATIFDDMAGLGDDVLKPFLQDVVKFLPLARTLLVTSLKHPGLVTKIIPHVGIDALVPWLGHYGALAGYTGLEKVGVMILPLINSLPGVQRYYGHRWLDALHYGSGKDY
ncbi:FAD-dependent oxidoreductase [filamentous cyanobacterium CCP5]|nr:FAD-dependent oxidoreductase [filamentous cyanobacterium CCP5]